VNNNVKKLVVASTTFLALGLATGSPAIKAATTDVQLAMMDDDKMSMKPDSSKSNRSNMGQPSGQSQNMGGGRMNDDKMQTPAAQMQDCQGSGYQQGSDMMQMMQMMERMMRGRMNSSSSTASNTDSTSGPADVTERIEGRIAFLKAELQITDKQLTDWNGVADALRSSRQHLLEARKLLLMDDKAPGTERIDHYERHLSERLEAIKSARAAFNRLYASLSDSQKQTADAILLPLIATF
jgi:hypothetical protein